MKPDTNKPDLPPTVFIDDIDSVRKGRQSEGLLKYTDSSAEDKCFSIIFKEKKKNLDLMASSKEEANQWVAGLEKILNNVRNMDKKQKSEQYPYSSLFNGMLSLYSPEFFHVK